MIITKTPLRISFAGGGSDLPAFYKKHGRGFVVSMTINKFVYVLVNRKFDEDIRVSYSLTENVADLASLKHDLIRSCLKKFNISQSVEIITVADVPGVGTGLGSSSSLTVGLVNALSIFKHKKELSKDMLADMATYIEIDMCEKPIGKQDQYAAAHGGLNAISFERDGQVVVTDLWSNLKSMTELDTRLMLFHLPRVIDGDTILRDQTQRFSTNVENAEMLEKMSAFAMTLAIELSHGEIDRVGEYLHENWMLKKKLSGMISNSIIDGIYDKAMDAGALGGKICGAGGGGFVLFYVPYESQDAVRKAVGLRELEFTFHHRGSEVVYVG